MLAGFKLVMVGVRASTSKGRALLVVVGFISTVTFTEPAMSRAVGTVADKEMSVWVPVGVRAVLPNWIVPPVRAEPLTVRVNCAPFELTEVGVSEEMCGPLKEKLFRFMSHAPRPWVAARKVREAACKRMERTAICGSPVPSVLQVQGVAEQLLTNTPRSVAV